MVRPIKDLTGKRFGKLVVKEFLGTDIHNGNKALWLCKCDCGNETMCLGGSLHSRNVKSCGCLVTDYEFHAEDCAEKLGISITSFQEIKYRLGYKGQKITLEKFDEIEKIVDDIKRRCNKVSLSNINWYWNYVREEK